MDQVTYQVKSKYVIPSPTSTPNFVRLFEEESLRSCSLTTKEMAT